MACWGCVSKGLHEIHDLKSPHMFKKNVFVIPHHIAQSYALNKYMQKNIDHLRKQQLKKVIVVFPSNTSLSKMNRHTKSTKEMFQNVHSVTNVPWSFINTTEFMGGNKGTPVSQQSDPM